MEPLVRSGHSWVVGLGSPRGPDPSPGQLRTAWTAAPLCSPVRVSRCMPMSRSEGNTTMKVTAPVSVGDERAQTDGRGFEETLDRFARQEAAAAGHLGVAGLHGGEVDGHRRATGGRTIDDCEELPGRVGDGERQERPGRGTARPGVQVKRPCGAGDRCAHRGAAGVADRDGGARLAGAGEPRAVGGVGCGQRRRDVIEGDRHRPRRCARVARRIGLDGGERRTIRQGSGRERRSTRLLRSPWSCRRRRCSRW